MSKCPYTWVMSLFKSPRYNLLESRSESARHLRVTVDKDGERTVDVCLPAQSAGWMIELIPTDVLNKIREEQIPIDEMQTHLKSEKNLLPQFIFELKENARHVVVWLE